MESRAAWTTRAAPLALALLAYGWCWWTGSRGFFALDQSIALDGGWRILNGQVPFIDFWTPHGLPLLAMLALAFETFGADFGTYLGFAAFENALAAVLVWSLVRCWTRAPGLALVGGVTTAIWFQAPHGTPFSEQSAFLLALAAWRALAAPRAPRLFLAGALAMLAILCKQNAGVLSLAISLLVLVERARFPPGSARANARRFVARFAIGFAAIGLGFLVWLVLASDPASFWRCYVVTPAELLGPRLGRTRLLVRILVGRGHLLVPVAGLFACLPPLVAWGRGTGADGRARFLALLCLGLHLHQSLFNLLTVNHPENGYPFAGLILALGASCIPAAYAERCPVRGAAAFRVLNRLAWGWITILILWVCLRGVKVGWIRVVHRPVLNEAEFVDGLPFDGWRSLRWGEPTTFEGESTRLADLVDLVEYLEQRPGNLFVFPEHTFLYALLGRVPPQPLLWFDAGVSYPAKGDARIDARIVSDLVRNDVRTVVLEERSFLEADEHLARLPALGAHLRNGFQETTRFGPFRVLER